MKIDIDDNIINVVIVRKSIKNMYFRIDEDLNLLVTANRWISETEIKRAIKDKFDSIIKMYNIKLKEKDADAYFFYLGDKYNVIYDNIKSITFDENNIITKDDKMLDKFYLNKCKELFRLRLDDKLKLFDLNFVVNLKLRKMKTRWGVCCPSKRTITLNTELLKKDLSLIDYVIIHEICHFYHLDHSRSFWQLVSNHYPYYKQARKMLRGV